MNKMQQLSDASSALDRSHLQLLLALRDTGRLSRAAEALSISPSAASHRLREAERRLGIVLARPDGRSIQLTPSGEHLADVAAVSEAALRSGEMTARWLAGGRSTSVRIAMDFYDSAPWFTAFGATRPRGIGVDLVRVAYDRAIEAVSGRRADVAMGPVGVDHLPVLDPGGSVRRIDCFDDELVAIVGPGHAAIERGAFIPDDVVDARYLTAGLAPTSGFEHSEFFSPAGVMPGELFQIESVALICRLVAEGRGLTIQPRRAVQHGLPAGAVLVPLADREVRIRWLAAVRAGDETALDLVEAIREHELPHRELPETPEPDMLGP